MRCRAVRDGDDYVLNGSKYWITNAGVSDTYTVFAKHRPDPRGAGGSPASWSRRDWGVEFPKHEDKMGLRASPTGEVVLQRRARPRDAPHRRRGRGLQDRDAHARPLAPDHRRPGRGHRPGGHRLRGRVHEGPQGLRRDRSPTCRAFASCSPTWRFAPRRRAPSSTARARRSTRATPTARLSYLGAAAKSFASDTAMSVADRRRATPRWLRLHQGLPRRAIHARRQDHPDLRGHQPGPARRRRQAPAALTVAARGAEPRVRRLALLVSNPAHSRGDRRVENVQGSTPTSRCGRCGSNPPRTWRPCYGRVVNEDQRSAPRWSSDLAIRRPGGDGEGLA